MADRDCTRACVYCGTFFRPRTRAHRYCSHECIDAKRVADGKATIHSRKTYAERNCDFCGASFVPSPKVGIASNCCSEECKRLADNRNTRLRRAARTIKCSQHGCEGLTNKDGGLCGTHYSRLRKFGDVNGKAKPRIDRPCQQCGKLMVGLRTASKQTTCSRACAARAGLIRRGLDVHPFIECAHCRKEFKRSLSNGQFTRFCSNKCKAQFRSEQIRSRATYVVTTYHAACPCCGARSSSRTRVLVPELCHACVRAEYLTKKAQCTCPDCGAAFARRSIFGRDQPKCDSCAEANSKRRGRIAKAKRRRLIEGKAAHNIDPIKVFERDGWRCHICKAKTIKAKRGTYHDRAPELDHIITLADGGTHTWGNVACACRKCNGAKSARSLGQLGFDLAA